MVTIISAKMALARLTKDSIASDSRPTESVMYQASVLRTMVTTATAAEAHNMALGEKKRPWVDVMPALSRSALGDNAAMNLLRRGGGWWLAAWIVISAAGAVFIAQAELSRLRESFETDARIVHRLLSQRAVEHDAVLATLALLQPGPDAASPEQRLPSLYPQILKVERRAHDGAWSDPALQAAEAQSRTLRRAMLAQSDLSRGRYQLVLSAEPASFALLIDVATAVPWADWPGDPKTSPARMTLESGTQQFVLQPGQIAPGGWRFDFRKHLAADSQPFDAVAQRQVQWHELPWWAMAGWVLASGLFTGSLAALRRQREQRLRAEELLRLGQVARLNTLGELAAGMAHELNQPLTAILANAQAAQRLLAEEPADIATAQNAMAQAVQQARRAADVVGRLRRMVERPDAAAHVRPVVLQDVVRDALHLLSPECARRQIDPQFEPASPAVWVMAEPVALEQIVHNLLVNALQALDQVPVTERQLAIAVLNEGPQAVLTVTDTGPGIAADLLPRIFEPFYSTRKDGLGLGLTLCETLVSNMGGSLSATHHAPRGLVMRLALPQAARP